MASCASMAKDLYWADSTNESLSTLYLEPGSSVTAIDGIRVNWKPAIFTPMKIYLEPGNHTIEFSGSRQYGNTVYNYIEVPLSFNYKEGRTYGIVIMNLDEVVFIDADTREKITVNHKNN